MLIFILLFVVIPIIYAIGVIREKHNQARFYAEANRHNRQNGEGH